MVKCLREDLDDLLTFFGFNDTSFRKKVRTTNAIERIFREVRRRTRPMGGGLREQDQHGTNPLCGLPL